MGLGEKIASTFNEVFKFVVENLMFWIQPKIIEEVRIKVATELFATLKFQTPEIQKSVDELVKDWSGSPDTIGALGDGLLKVVVGKGAQLQLESIINAKIDDRSPVTGSMFGQMAIVTDVTLLSNILSFAGEFLSFGQLDDLGKQLREYLSFSGLSQATQFGYGALFSSAIGPLVQRELNQLTRPTTFDEPTSAIMRFKGLINKDTYTENLSKLGYTDTRAENLFTNSWFYPSASDFIRFSVREVFRNDIVEKFGYDEGFPIDEKIQPAQQPAWVKEVSGGKVITLKQAVEFARLDPEILRMFWRAHWELPSPNQGFEMLHRRVIDQDELETLLKIADFAPFWIPKLIDISFTPFTRVDARRMFEVGVLDDEGYLDALLDLGHSPEKAQQLLDWTRVRKMAPERDLTKAQIEKAFREGLKSRVWTIESLQGLGYDKDESELIVLLIEHDEQSKEREDIIDHLVRVRSQDKITEDEFSKGLDTLGITETHKSKIGERLEREQRARTRLPTKTDLITWLREGLIPDTIFRDRMISLGFLNDDITLFIDSIDREPSKGDFIRWLTEELITVGEFKTRMGVLGFSELDIETFIKGIEAKQEDIE